jgi:hypothetical protein
MTGDPSARSYWWLSFVDRIGSEVAVNLGVSIVVAESLQDAVRAAWKAGINPGGEVAGTPLPEDLALHYSLVNKLLDQPADVAEAQLAISNKTTLTTREEPS